jgi:hypothetical protein
MSDNRVEIHYQSEDVTSAQRMRILRNRQFILLLALWGLGVVFVILHILLPGVLNFIPGVTWDMVGQVFLAYLGSILALLYVVPWFSFLFTRFWRLPLLFQYNNKSIRLSVIGKTGGLRLNWDEVRNVDENKRVFVIYYEDGARHFIVPKSAFSDSAERRFRDLLDRRFAPKSSPAVPEEDTPEEDVS